MEDSCISILHLIINNEKHIFFSILFAATSPLIVTDGVDCSTQWACSNMWYEPPFTPIARWGLVSRGYENQYRLIRCVKEGNKEKIANVMKKYVRELKRINRSICPSCHTNTVYKRIEGELHSLPADLYNPKALRLLYIRSLQGWKKRISAASLVYKFKWKHTETVWDLWSSQKR